MNRPVDRGTVIHNLVDCCKRAPKKKEILKALRKRRNYREVAKIVGIKNANNCLASIKEMKDVYGLVEQKDRGDYEVIPLLKRINIDAEIRKAIRQVGKELKVRPQRKKYLMNAIRKDIELYFQNDFLEIRHPFDKTQIEKIEPSQLKTSTKNFFDFLEKPIVNERFKGLNLRFYPLFADYFSILRTKRIELINTFSNLIRLFEPIVKKIAFLKTNDERMLKKSLDNELIKAVFPTFGSDVKKTEESYWKGKTIPDATIRYVYPYRHIETHEARDYTVFEIEKIAYYLFASLIFICQ